MQSSSYLRGRARSLIGLARAATPEVGAGLKALTQAPGIDFGMPPSSERTMVVTADPAAGFGLTLALVCRWSRVRGRPSRSDSLELYPPDVSHAPGGVQNLDGH